MRNRIGMLALLILFLSPSVFSQFTSTANLGLRKPNQGITTNWNVYINGDFDELDALLSGFSNLSLNSTTPSVQSSNRWVAANTAATTIANFTGGYSGQLFTMICQDTLTSVVTSATINLNGAFNCNAGISISFTLINSIWVEVGRVQPGSAGIDSALLSGSNTYTGNNTFSGNTSLRSQNGVTLFADQFTNIAAAIAACPTAGCIVDARSPLVNLVMGTSSIDPLSTPVTLLLGPYTYTTPGITIENYFHVLGAARGSTVIQSSSTTAPIFTLGGTSAVYSFDIEHTLVFCGAGNSSQIGFNIVAQGNGGGLNYSNFKDVTIGGDGVHECGGESILLDGSAGGSPPAINQFLNFTNVQAFRRPNGAPAFHVRGVGGQMFIANSQFDGNATRDTLPNVVIEDSAFSGFTAAYSIAFYETTFQRGGTAIKLRGSTNFSCDNCHFENVTGIIDAAIGQNYGNIGAHITHSYCATACAVSSGSGFLTKTDVNSQLAVDYLSLSGTPDNYWTGTSIAHLEHQGLFNFSSGTTYPSPNSSFRIPVGIDCDSPGFKCATASTGPITAGARANVAITFGTPFPDASYAPVCIAEDFTTAATSQGVIVERVNDVLANTGFSLTVFNPTGGTVTSNVFCTVVHI
jgi:hypothetical protein